MPAHDIHPAVGVVQKRLEALGRNAGHQLAVSARIAISHRRRARERLPSQIAAHGRNLIFERRVICLELLALYLHLSDIDELLRGAGIWLHTALHRALRAHIHRALGVFCRRTAAAVIIRAAIAILRALLRRASQQHDGRQNQSRRQDHPPMHPPFFHALPSFGFSL